MNRFFVLLLALFVASGAASAQSSADPFRVEVPATRLDVDGSGVLEVRVVVPKGHHIYKDMVRIDVLDKDGLELGAADIPPGLMRPDPASPGQDREVYPFDLIIEIPVKAPSSAGVHDPLVEVGYQGCREGLCYPPAVHQLSPLVLIGDASGRRYLEYGSAWVDAAGSGSTVDHPPDVRVNLSDVVDSATDADTNPDGSAHPVVARMIADRDAVVPGGSLRLGIHLEQAEGWHTYWRSPGEVGQPPRIEWSLPAGSTSSEMEFAVPTRFSTESAGKKIISYGYDGENLLFTNVVLPDSLEGAELELAATVSWLVCEATCIPGDASLRLTLPVADEDPGQGPYAPLFDAYEALHPTPIADVEGLTVTIGVPADLRDGEEGFMSVLIQPDPDVEVSLPVSAEEDLWPGYIPITGPHMIWDMGSRLHTASPPTMGQGSGESRSAEGLLVTTELYILPDLMDSHPTVGALLQLELNGERVITEVFGSGEVLTPDGGRYQDDSAVSVAASGTSGDGSSAGESLTVQAIEGYDAASLDFEDKIPWIGPFNESNLRKALCSGSPIFVDFTAAWCISCKALEASVLETDDVRQAMREHGVIPMKADFTNEDPYIKEWLDHFKAAGVPYYLVIPPGGGVTEADLRRLGDETIQEVIGANIDPLGELITIDEVVGALEKSLAFVPSESSSGESGEATVGEQEEVEGDFAGMLLLALAGGFVLNFFPCVLPVLALKLYSLIEQRDAPASARKAAGVAYTLGVVLSFLGVALAVIILKEVFSRGFCIRSLVDWSLRCAGSGSQSGRTCQRRRGAQGTLPHGCLCHAHRHSV
jgi:thiol:disulfide interchange protein/DsbC/DsbD-like thiol-disulfide interchange protein